MALYDIWVTFGLVADEYTWPKEHNHFRLLSCENWDTHCELSLEPFRSALDNTTVVW